MKTIGIRRTSNIDSGSFLIWSRLRRARAPRRLAGQVGPQPDPALLGHRRLRRGGARGSVGVGVRVVVVLLMRRPPGSGVGEGGGLVAGDREEDLVQAGQGGGDMGEGEAPDAQQPDDGGQLLVAEDGHGSSPSSGMALRPGDPVETGLPDRLGHRGQLRRVRGPDVQGAAADLGLELVDPAAGDDLPLLITVSSLAWVFGLLHVLGWSAVRSRPPRPSAAPRPRPCYEVWWSSPVVGSSR
ncbi:hypothetical protein SMICM304S_04586 [Streptomyces microflavus]